MERFRFAYKEVNVGFVEIDAGSEEEARELLEIYGCDPYINNSDTEIGELIESYKIETI
jgi:hypothetical protein